MANSSRGYFGSTEPQARKILEGIQKRTDQRNGKILPPATGNVTTATNPPGIQKTPEQGRKELEELRRKHNKT